MKTRMISMLALVAIVAGSTDAFASRARINVMGKGDAGLILNSTGSLYYDDMYNIFYNPSYINDFKNYVIVEKGSVAGTNEGGFTTSFMGVNVGAFLNRVDAFELPTGPTNPITGTNLRPVDIVIGGDHGVKWGIGATYARANGTQFSGTSNNLALRAGAQVADFAPFVNYRVTGEEKATTGSKDKVKDMTIGLQYHYGEWTPYAAYRMMKTENAPATVGYQPLYDGKAWIVGAARNTKLGENARLVYTLAFARHNVSKSGSFAGTTYTAGTTKPVRTIMPIDFALEGDVASWITVRAGLGYRLMDRLSGGADTTLVGGAVGRTGTAQVSTTGRVGATFHINKIDLDWAYGNGAANIDADSVGFDGGTFTNLSVSYKW